MMDEEDFEKYQLWRDVKKNYFKNKVEHYKALQNKEDKSIKFVEEETENYNMINEGNLN